MLLTLPSRSVAQTAAELDSTHISLLTCSPHDEVYSLYGHTALRVENRLTGSDIAVNWGMFSFKKPFFVLRFVFGLTDYEMGVTSFDDFCAEYRYYGSGVTAQELALTPSEKAAVLEALAANARPENRTYRYNFFYDNCTTRARDMITSHIRGRVEFAPCDSAVTFRQMLHAMTADHPWAQLGNDLLLGVGADRPLSARDRIFLPHSTKVALARAYIRGGAERKLVAATTTVVEPDTRVMESEFPLSPVQCALIVLAATLAVTLTERWRRVYIWGFDAVLLTATGIAGLLLTAMIFSRHPTVSVNAQILLFSPLPLLFGFQAVRRRCHGRRHWLWATQAALAAIMLLAAATGVQWIDGAVMIVAVAQTVRGVACSMPLRRL